MLDESDSVLCFSNNDRVRYHVVQFANNEQRDGGLLPPTVAWPKFKLDNCVERSFHGESLLTSHFYYELIGNTYLSSLAPVSRVMAERQ